MRKVYPQFIFLLVLLVLQLATRAQYVCGTDEIHRQLLQNKPAFKKTIEFQTAKWVQYNKEKSLRQNRPLVAPGDSLVIPVVIHVIHSGQPVGSGNNPSDDDLIAMIAGLNAVYAGNYHEQGINTDGSVNVPIRFKLARRSPDCQPTNGINRVDGSVLPGYSDYGVYYSGDKHGPYDSEVKALSRWPTSSYMNIWIVTSIEGTVPGGGLIGGYATFPGNTSPEDGIVVVNTNVGLLAHEVGHYLFLYHTFEGNGDGTVCPPNNDCAIEGDQVCDTEPHYSFSCNTGINPCTNLPWGLVGHNFMNYYWCDGMFTAGQNDRMQYALEELRSSLLTSLGALPAGIATNSIPSPVASCKPATIIYPDNGFDIGPRTIQVANMLVETNGYTGDGNQFYVDHTTVSGPGCLNSQQPPVVYLIKGSTYGVTVTNGYNPENVRGWIDYNNNGVFQSSELIISNNGTANNETHSASFTVPLTGVATCTSLRMRISSDYISSVPQPCSDLEYGQAEDFLVIIQEQSKPLPALTIAANTTNLICAGTNVVFTATPVNGGSNPAYQWKKNGINVGTNSPTFTTAGLVNGDIISCTMTPSFTCAAFPVVGSNLLVMSVSPASPSISISTPATRYCEDANIVFRATQVNGGSGPRFQWKRNGINVGANSDVFSSNSLANGDVISCVMTIAETCPATQSATSNQITVNLSNPPAGTIITPSPKAACLPDQNINSTYSAGPRAVTLADLQYAFQGNSGDNQNYLDHTLPGMPACFPLVAHLNKGNTYTITVNTGDQSENVRGWIDFNNDGIFQSSELIITSDGTTSYQLHSATFTVPVSGIANCTSLRMRIISDLAGGNPPPQPCSRLQSGRVEDFIIIVQGSTSIIPSVSISIPQNLNCEGSNVTFTAIPVNGGSNPRYQWILNGNSVGTNSNTFNSSTLKMGDEVHCVMTSSETAICTPAVTSNSITMTVYPVTTPTVSIAADITGPVCAGTNITFLASPAHAQLPGFTWKVNGQTVSHRQYIYSTSTLKNGDVVSCEISSSDPCSHPQTATSDPIVIEVLPGPIPSVSVCANNNGTFTARALNFNINPTYQWKLNGTDVGTNNSIYSNNTLGDGDFIICVITGSTACASSITATSNSINISSGTVVKPEIYVYADKTNPICPGTAVTFTAFPTNGGANPKYQWKIGNSLVGSNSPTYTASNLTNGSVVTCTLTSNASCASTNAVTSQGLTVSVSAPPLTSIVASGLTTFCAGKNVVLKATVATGYTYQWKKAGVNIDNATGSSYTATTAGAYSVLITNAGGCSATSQTMNVTINPVPLASVAAGGPLTFCEGKNVQLKAITGTGYTYQWKRGAADITGANLSTYTAVTTGIYTVTVTNASGCSAISAGINVVVKPLPTATITPAGPTTFCSDKNVLLRANTGTNYTYQWIRGASPVAGATQPNFTANLPGLYTVVVKNSSGCSVTSPPVAIAVNPLPIATITTTTPLTFCSGQQVLLRANTGTNYTYQWRKAGINIPGATQVNYPATASGVYSVIVTNAAGCAVTSLSVTVTVNNVPLTNLAAASATTFCAGKNVLLKAITGTGYTYQWKKNGLVIPNETGSNYPATVSGNYSVVISNTLGCSAPSVTIPVTVIPAPLATVAVAGTLTFCEGKNILLKAITGTGYTYQWKRNGNNIPAQTQANFTAATTGVYTVAVTNTEGCTTLSAEINVNVIPAPPATVTANGPLTFPQGGNVELAASALTGNTWQWKKDGVNITGATSDKYIAVTSGSYSVAITSSAGCVSNSLPVVVTVTQTRPVTKTPGMEDMVRVYPSPLYRNEVLNIDWNIHGGDKGIRVIVYDAAGRKISTQVLTAYAKTIKITGASGVYFVEVRWGENKRKVFKVTKFE